MINTKLKTVATLEVRGGYEQEGAHVGPKVLLMLPDNGYIGVWLINVI